MDAIFEGFVIWVGVLVATHKAYCDRQSINNKLKRQFCSSIDVFAFSSFPFTKAARLKSLFFAFSTFDVRFVDDDDWRDSHSVPCIRMLCAHVSLSSVTTWQTLFDQRFVNSDVLIPSSKSIYFTQSNSITKHFNKLWGFNVATRGPAFYIEVIASPAAQESALYEETEKRIFNKNFSLHTIFFEHVKIIIFVFFVQWCI